MNKFISWYKRKKEIKSLILPSYFPRKPTVKSISYIVIIVNNQVHDQS